MWTYIIAAIILVEIAGGVFFYSLIRTSHGADGRLAGMRRLRIARRKAVKFMRRQLKTPTPSANWTELQQTLHTPH
ncbi:MAG: hypothetical protein QM617_01235 [Comamonas sp.]